MAIAISSALCKHAQVHITVCMGTFTPAQKKNIMCNNTTKLN